jgi:hypothetical protein
MRPLEECLSWLDHGAELNRSLWDRESLLAHLDVEYVNFDHPAHPFVAQEQVFEMQRPVVAFGIGLACFWPASLASAHRTRASLCMAHRQEITGL